MIFVQDVSMNILFMLVMKSWAKFGRSVINVNVIDFNIKYHNKNVFSTVILA